MAAAIAILGVGVLGIAGLVAWWLSRPSTRSETEVLSQEIARHLQLAARASEDGKPGLAEDHMNMVDILKQRLANQPQT